MDYRREFLHALDFSESRKFGMPDWCRLRSPLEIRPCLTSTHRKILKDLFDTLMRESGAALFVGQCLNVSLIVAAKIGQMTNIDPAITLGWVEDGNKKLFKFTSGDLDRWIKEGIDNPLKLNIHAWLTLPGLEVVDFSLPMSINHFDSSHPSSPVIDRWNEARYRYHPIAVCCDSDLSHRFGFQGIRVIDLPLP